MPAAEEAAGGESARPPLLPPHSQTPSGIRRRDRGWGVPEHSPSFPDPTQAGVGRSSISGPRTQLGPSGHSNPSLSTLNPQDPQVKGGGDHGPTGQVLGAVPFPRIRTMGSWAHPVPVPCILGGIG